MDPVKLAVFDFDGTLIKGDTIIPYLKLARHLKALPLSRFLGILCKAPLYALGLLSDTAYKTYAMAFYAGLSGERQVALDRVFVDEWVLPRLYRQGRAAMEGKKAEGYHVVILSASTENYMQYAAHALQADGLICTKLNEKAEVILNCKGENKPLLLQKYLKEKELEVDWEASCAYGDSKSDVPVLQMVGNPIIVNGKRKLKKAAPHFPQVNWQ